MNKNGTWTAWTFKVGNKAFKAVRPLSISMDQELVREAVSVKWFFFKTYELMPTGRWSITIVYDRGSHTITQSDKIYFKSKAEAQSWFDTLYSEVFTVKRDHKVPPPPKPKKKGPSTKKTPHLTIIDND